MIWGETKEVRNKRYDEQWKRLKDGYRWFAWYPVEIETGETVWLETVIRRWISFPYLSGGRIGYIRIENNGKPKEDLW